MSTLTDTPERYGRISRVLHWGMAILFLAQFLSAASRVFLPRENEIRSFLWGYHVDLGVTLFVLVLLRGLWGLINLRRRPSHPGFMGRMAKAGHVAMYALMILVPGVRLLAAAGGTRGLSWFGIAIFPPLEAEIAWMQGPAEWHGEMGWILALLIAGHIAIAVGWHHFVRRDATLTRMAS